MGKLNNESEPIINHMSHEHPLHLINHNPNLTLAPSSCSGCKIPLIQGLTYTCKLCNYYLHIKCSQMPQKIKHPFDQNHVLCLFPTPLYPEGVFKCIACGENGSGFSYRCGDCSTDVHILCASMPLSTTHHTHHHTLNLIYLPPYLNKSFVCDVCKEVGGNHWLYRCSMCEFDAHLSCGTSKPVLPVQINPYQQMPGISVPVVQTPPQPFLQRIFSGYRAGAGMPTPGTSYMNQPPNNFTNYMNTGAPGSYSPSTTPAFQTNNQRMPGFYPGAPQEAGQQMFPAQLPGRGDANNSMLLQGIQSANNVGGNVNAQLLQAILSANNGGGNVNAQLLQAILSANNGGCDPNTQLFQMLTNGGGGYPNAQLLQAFIDGGGGGGGVTNQLIQGFMGGEGGGGFDLSSLVGLMGGGGGGGFDVSSIMDVMGGLG